MSFITGVIAVLAFGFLIFVHEFGHYVAGKLLGFKINEFSIGFGKAIYQKSNPKTGEKFSIRVVPLGGYCAFDGEDENESSPTSFNSQKPWKRFIVQFAGAFFNIVFGIITSAVLLWAVGYDIPVVQSVSTTAPVEITQNLQVGDVIRKVDGKKISVWGGNYYDTLMKGHNAGDTIVLTVSRDGKTIDVVETFYEYTDADGNKSNVIGITTTSYKHGFWEGLGRSFEVAFGIAGQVLVSLWQLITGQVGLTALSGPVGTISLMASLAEQSLMYILLLLPVLSINLGIFNLIPFPALDGGRMVFTLWEMITHKPVKRELEAKIHFIGILVLFSLVILVDLIGVFT